MIPSAPRPSALALHALVLAALDLAAILVGFWVWKASGVTSQLSVQLPIALVTVVILFASWAQGVSGAGSRRGWALDKRRQAAAVLGLSLLIAPALFVLLHRITQGYWTAWTNLASLAAFQLPTNALAVGAAALLTRPVVSAPALLFVYGTLRRGRPGESRLGGRGRWMGEGIIAADLYEVDGYPGAVPSETGRVHGDVFALESPEHQLGELDRFEMAVGPRPEYLRTLVDVELESGEMRKAWAYLYARSVADLRLLPEGVWPEASSSRSAPR